MKVIIGTVKELSGKFFAKDEHGDITELHAGDPITKDMLVFGADANSENAHIKIAMLNLEQALELTGLEKQVFDLSLIQDGNNLDEFISPNSIDKALEKTGVYAQDAATDQEKAGSINDETAAGSEAVVGHIQEDQFTARDNGFVDVQSSLRDAQFNGSDNTVNIDATPVLLTNNEGDIPGVVPSPAPTPLPILTITLDANITADDTINASEAEQNIPVTGRVGGDFNIGDTVTLTVNSKTFTGAVDANGDFSINVPGADLAADPDTTIDASVTTTDAAGNTNSATDTESYTVDTAATAAPTVTITEDTNNDGLISSSELSGQVDVQIALPAGAAVGDTLNVTNPDTTVTNVTITQDMIDNGYTTAYDAPADGQNITVSATVTDAAGNTSLSASDSATMNFATETSSDTNTVLEDNSASGNVLTNDVDADNTLTITSFTVTGDTTTYSAGNIATIGNVGTLQVNSDGSYTFTPVANWSGDVPQVTYTTDTGASDTLNITVTAVADAPTLDVTSDTIISQVIDINNVTDTNSGFTITAVAADGSASTISTHNGPDGFGVTGAASGADAELGYLDGVGSEKLIVDFDNDVSSVDVSFAWKSATENAIYTFYKNGVEVGSGTSIGGSDGVDPAVTLQPDNGALFDQIVFSAPSGGDNDYLINSITYNRVVSTYDPVVMSENSSVDIHINSNLVDTDGSESLQVAIQDVPVGFTISDGTNSFTADTTTSTVDITNWDMNNLTLSAPVQDNSVSDTLQYTLNVVATSTEASNADSAVSSYSLVVNVTDTAPTAMDDQDSVGYGGEAVGNVITGDGGNDVTPDVLGEDATQIAAVIYNGTSYNSFDVNGNVVLTTDNGTLTLNQDGTYTYDSAYVVGSVSGTDEIDWNDANIGYYGITSGNDPFDSNGNLDMSVLTQSNSDNVNFNDSNGLGVDNTKVDDNEYLVFDLNGKTSNVDVELSDFGNRENVDWYAYNELGELVGSGSKRGNDDDILNITANQTSASNIGSDFIQYIVVDPENNTEIRVEGLSYDVDSSLNISDTFSYELQDSDGDSSVADFTVAHEYVPTAITDIASVNESALSDGTDAGSGNDVTSGNLLTNDLGISSNATITDVNGVSASDGVITVITSNGTLVVDAATGDYTYTLNNANDNGDTIVDSFTYSVSSNNQTSSAELNVSIIDDVPIGNDVVQNLQDSSADSQTTNLIIVLDRSGSMAWDLEGDAEGDADFNADQVRMDIAKEALQAMFDSFDDLGNVNIKFVDFSDTVNESAWFVDDKEAANSYLEGVTPGGGTYYDDALNATMNGFNPPPADKTLTYFISDGEPNSGHEVDESLQGTWESFLTDNSIDISFGIGITESSDLESLNPIAYPDTNNDGVSEPYAIQVLDAIDLKQTLLDTVDEGIVQGDAAIVSGTSTSGIVLGADGGHIESVSVDGTTYSYDASNPTQSITTASGGIFDMNFDTGEYVYTINPQNTVSGESEIFSVTAIDGDGDTKSIDLTINLDFVANIDANADNIITNANDGDTLSVDYSALTHNDNLSDGMSVTDVVANSGTDVTTSASTVTFSDVADGESISYTISDGTTSDTTHADVTLQNSDSLQGTRYDDIIIANRQNSRSAEQNRVNAIVLPGDTYNQNNQIGFDFTQSLNGLAITSITLDLSNDNNAYFDTSGSGSTAPSIGADTSGISSSDVTFDAPDGSQTLQINFTEGSFTAGDSFWFGVDTDYLGDDTGVDYGLEGTQVTVTYSDGSTTTATYQAEADGSSSAVVSDGNVIMGGDGNDTLMGNSNDELLDGGAGNDQLLAGGGDDTLVYDSHDSVIDGGSGFDTLVLANNDSIDFSALDATSNPIANIEKIDLTQGDHTLDNLSLDDVLDMTDTNNTLQITGDGADQVNVDTTGWTQQGTAVDDGTSTTYTYSNDSTSDSVTLVVDDNVQNTGL